MADRPIIFSGPMIRALLAGTKTQTRRILKPQPPTPEQFPGSVFGLGRSVADGVKVYSLNDLGRLPKHPTKWDLCGSVGVARNAGFPMTYRVPYAVGDRLWVCEAWCHTGTGVWSTKDADLAIDGKVIFRADDNGGDPGIKWFSPLHLPRKRSRLTLTVSEVRVERLQDISEADARAEGVTIRMETGLLPSRPHEAFPVEDHRGAFQRLWCELHGPASWDASPWVAAISFEATPANIDSLPEEP